MPEPELPVVLTAPARADITTIFEYLCEQASPVVASDIYSQFFDIFDRLGHYPESGAPRDNVFPHYRMVPVSSWAVWYYFQPQSQEVTILRVLHGAMDAERHLL